MNPTKPKSTSPAAPLPDEALIRCQLRRDAYALANVLLTQGPLTSAQIAPILHVSQERASDAVDSLHRMKVAQLRKGQTRIVDALEDRWFSCPYRAFRFTRELVKLSFKVGYERWDLSKNPLPLCWIAATTHSEVECALFELGAGLDDERLIQLNEARDEHPIYGDIFSGVNDDAELALARARLRLLNGLVAPGLDYALAEAALSAYYSEVEAVLFVSPAELVRH